MTFRELGLIAPILNALTEQGYETPSPIQRKAIPPALQGRDVLGCAQTGTGKTCAFAAPILQRLNKNKVNGRPIRALILTPTRELAIQIGESFQAYGRHLKLRCAVIFGGVGQNPQVEALKQGVDILIATPGRLEDLHQQGFVDVSKLEIFVLDEADRMLDMGFIHDVRKILKWLPAKKQTLFFSATMPPEITDLVNSLLHDPVKVAVDPISSPVEAIDQSIYFVDKGNKTKLLAHLVEVLGVKNALVFTRTKHGANKVARDLEKAGITAAAIHGNKSQTARQQALADFKAGSIQCLVATDIAARGLDIEYLSHVFNYNLTEVPETYIHRIGRTGRAGREGVAVSLCDFAEQELLRGIEKLIGRKLPVVEDHPYPMTNFEAPKRDKHGKIINADDAEARQAARERKKERQEQEKQAKQEKRTEKPAPAPVEEVKAAPAEDTPAKKKRKRKKKKSAETVENSVEFPVPEPLDTGFEIPEMSYLPKTERPRLVRSGILMDTGDSLPNTEFHRPNPLDSDVIMDATARLLAPRKPMFSSTSSGYGASSKPEPPKQEKKQEKKPEKPVKQEKKKPKQEPKQAEPVKQPVPAEETPAKKKRKKKKKSAAAPAVQPQSIKQEQPRQEKKQVSQKPAPAHAEKPAQTPAASKNKKKRKKTHTPNLDAQKPQLKDSTEQESLMKPFYLTF